MNRSNTFRAETHFLNPTMKWVIRLLFICSKSGYNACHDNIEKSLVTLDDYRRYEVFGGVSSNGEAAKMKAIVEEDSELQYVL